MKDSRAEKPLYGESVFDGVIYEPADSKAKRLMTRPKPGPDSELTGLDSLDFSGYRIGSLSVERRNKKNRFMWDISCACGRVFQQPAAYLSARKPSNAMCPACRNKEEFDRNYSCQAPVNFLASSRTDCSVDA